MSEVTGISRTSIQRILKHYKWHPYKIQLLHELNEDDHDRRLQFCEIISGNRIGMVKRRKQCQRLIVLSSTPYKDDLNKKQTKTSSKNN
nr:unnamed protein product [Callosobruchus chinensis]